MTEALFWHRLQFAFTATYHYLFPQLTMGLALLIAIAKLVGWRTRDERWNDVARFWIRIFGLTFAIGVVTGIPMEFQFGTNWAGFTTKTGGVIGQTLAMEGMFAFFLESSFLALLVLGERRIGPRGHVAAALALFFGSWLSGYFIVATDAFMQHPVGYALDATGTFSLVDLHAFVFNRWALAQYAHTMMGAAVTGSFVMASIGAYWTLRGERSHVASLSLRVGVMAGLVTSVITAVPTGHVQGRLVAEHQPVALAAMEGRFESGPRASLAVIGQPNTALHRLDNPIHVPAVLSYIAYGDFSANVNGLDAYAKDEWPTTVPLLYYGFHVMVGLGTLFIALMIVAATQLWRGRLVESRWLLWVLMLSAPFPFIANTAGWMTAELGRQPWLVYGLMRTSEGASPTVHDGATIFTLIGFAGLYLVLGVLYLFLFQREVAAGPSRAAH